MAEQTKAKRKIEEAVEELLDGDARQSALGFIAYLREGKIALSQTYADTWRAGYKGKSVCRIILKDNSWAFKPNDDFRSGYEPMLADEKITRTALKNIFVKPCRECSKSCAGGVDAAILGKDYKNICKHYYIEIMMPDAEAVECAKRIVEIRRGEIAAE